MLRLFLILFLALNLNAGIIKKTVIAGAGAVAVKKGAPALKKKVASKVKNSKTVKDLKEKATTKGKGNYVTPELDKSKFDKIKRLFDVWNDGRFKGNK